jgi:hypothetical protein
MQRTRFFSSGFEWRSQDPFHDYEFISYKDVEYVSCKCATVELRVRKRSEEYLEENTNTSEEALELVQEIRMHMQTWLDRDAVQRKEEREFRAQERAFHASLLAHLGKLTERIAFDPDVGDEALDTIERCKKRARGEGKEE